MKSSRPRFVFYVIPAAAIFAVAFGVIYGWIGVRALIDGAGWFGVILVVFGIAGIALGLALWRAWRMIIKRAGGDPGQGT